jgi:hypothetical protein
MNLAKDTPLQAERFIHKIVMLARFLFLPVTWRNGFHRIDDAYPLSI